jgi:hypothetical protein
LGKTMPGDLLVAIGKPKLGNEVVPAEARGEIADLKNVIWLSNKKYVHDIVPVGTFGIEYEARMMAFAVGRQLRLAENVELDLEKSAGPATVVLATMSREKFEELKSIIQKPVTAIGEIL